MKFGKYDVFANMKWLEVEVEKKQQQQYMEHRLKLYQQRCVVRCYFYRNEIKNLFLEGVSNESVGDCTVCTSVLRDGALLMCSLQTRSRAICKLPLAVPGLPAFRFAQNRCVRSCRVVVELAAGLVELHRRNRVDV